MAPRITCQLAHAVRAPGYPLARVLERRRRFERKRAMLPNHLERREHHALIGHVAERQRLTHVDYGCHHSPNEQERSTARQRAAALGTSNGYPDIVFHCAFELGGVTFAGLAIELKRVKWKFRGVAALEVKVAQAIAQGREDEASQHILAQARWLERLRRGLFVAEFARGAFEAIELFELCYGEYLGPLWG